MKISLARFCAALVALLLAIAHPAVAHETTRSYLSLTAAGSTVTADFRVAFRDIEVAVWMDENLDGQITWGETKQRLDAVQAYILSNVTLTTADGGCSLDRNTATTLQDTGIDYLDLSFSGNCPKPASGNPTLTLHSSLFTDIDPDHRMFVTATIQGIRSTALISRAAPDLALDAASAGSVATLVSYFRGGIDHLAEGRDHIVFLLALMLPFICSTRGPKAAALGILTAVTGFTIAHALTLTAGATQILRPNSAVIEALIAVSIIVTALDNIRPFLPLSRAAVAAFFGTIHGFGFASALGTLNIGGGALAVALLGFNLGIETAQIVLVLLTMPILYLLGAGKWVLWSGSAAAAAIGMFWLLQRLPAIL